MSSETKTVLLVDDAPANLQVVNSILKSTYKIKIATSGAKALTYIGIQKRTELQKLKAGERMVYVFWSVTRQSAADKPPALKNCVYGSQ